MKGKEKSDDEWEEEGGIRDMVRVDFFFQAEDGIRDLVRSRGLGMCIRDRFVLKPILSQAVMGPLILRGVVLASVVLLASEVLSLIHI